MRFVTWVKAKQRRCKATRLSRKKKKKPEHDWRLEVRIFASYKEYSRNPTEIFYDFESLSDGHLGRANIAKHRIELSPADAERTHSALKTTTTKARELEKH